MGFLTAAIPMPYRILGMVLLLLGLYAYAHHEGVVEGRNEDAAEQATAMANVLKRARTQGERDAQLLAQVELDKQALRKALNNLKGVRNAIEANAAFFRNPVCTLDAVSMCYFNTGDAEACKAAAGSLHDALPRVAPANGPHTGRRNPVSQGGGHPNVSGLSSQPKVPR